MLRWSENFLGLPATVAWFFPGEKWSAKFHCNTQSILFTCVGLISEQRLFCCHYYLLIFPVVMCECGSWTIKKCECQRIDASELWCWRRLNNSSPTIESKTLESPSDCKEIQPVHPKGNQSWIFIGRTDVEAEAPILWPPDGKELTHWKRPWCWERLKAGEEGADRGWDGWMASLTQWTWVWASSGSWW